MPEAVIIGKRSECRMSRRSMVTASRSPRAGAPRGAGPRGAMTGTEVEMLIGSRPVLFLREGGW